MIARLSLVLPFRMFVPVNAAFEHARYDDGEYQVTIRSPSKSDLPGLPGDPDEVKLGVEPAFIADCITIDFVRAEFDRSPARFDDPPEAVVQRALDIFTTRLRYVSRGAQVIDLNFPQATWRLQFLADDETELPVVDGKIRTRTSRELNVSGVKVTPDVYQDMFNLAPNWTPPPWYDFFVEAEGAVARGGLALVLAMTGLEVFVADVLDRLADRSGTPPALWKLMTDRKDPDKNPSTDEQFDILLRHFTGHSLKEDQTLWQAFTSLRTARNRFVHTGVARVGTDIVTRQIAALLVLQAREIVLKVREWLPAEIHWPEFGHTVEVSARFKLSK